MLKNQVLSKSAQFVLHWSKQYNYLSKHLKQVENSYSSKISVIFLNLVFFQHEGIFLRFFKFCQTLRQYTVRSKIDMTFLFVLYESTHQDLSFEGSNVFLGKFVQILQPFEIWPKSGLRKPKIMKIGVKNQKLKFFSANFYYSYIFVYVCQFLGSLEYYLRFQKGGVKFRPPP